MIYKTQHSYWIDLYWSWHNINSAIKTGLDCLGLEISYEIVQLRFADFNAHHLYCVMVYF